MTMHDYIEMIIAQYRKRITELEAENAKINGLYDDAMARLKAFHTPGSIGAENAELRTLTQNMVDNSSTKSMSNYWTLVGTKEFDKLAKYLEKLK